MALYIANAIILSILAILVIGILIDVAVAKFGREGLHLLYAACIVSIANILVASYKIYEHYQNLPVEILM